MPSLHKKPRGVGYSLRDDRQDPPLDYELAEEGERFLTAVLSLKDGDAVRPGDLGLLVDRGWAVLRPAEIVEAATPAIMPEAPLPKPPAPSRKPDANRQNATSTRRTRGREVALQILYQMEQNGAAEPKQMDLFIQRRLRDEKLQAFTRSLVAGVREHLAKLDELISGVAENWRIDRMAAIDRNILRLGAYEMLYRDDVPPKVAINEALELAKRYSTAQSSRFVNGILDRLQGSSTEPVVIVPEEPSPEPSAAPPE